MSFNEGVNTGKAQAYAGLLLFIGGVAVFVSAVVFLLIAGRGLCG